MKRRRIIPLTLTKDDGRFAIIEPNADETDIIKTPLGRFLAFEVIDARPKAWSGGESEVVSYDEDSEVFQKITRQKSTMEAPVMWGCELVIRVLDEEFNFFLGNNHNRQLGFYLATRRAYECLLTQVLIESGSGKYKWFTPKLYSDIVDARVETARRIVRAEYEPEPEDNGRCSDDCEICV